MFANIPGANTPATALRLIMTTLAPLLVWGMHSAAAQDGLQCGAKIGPADPPPGDGVFLDSDIGPCDTDPALTIEGPVTVDLNGFTVSCAVPDAEEGFVGIEVEGFNALVLNGVVEDCEDGVVVSRDGGQHILTKLTVRSTQHQVGNRGFRVRSDGNQLVDNRVHRFSGVGFRVQGSHNSLVNNVAFKNEDEGFRIDEDATYNTLIGNRARNNGATDGEAGIRIQGDYNTVVGNSFIHNFGDGILLTFDEGDGQTPPEAAENNTIIHNVAVGNGATDLVDESPDCDGNLWSNNRFRTKSQDCID